MQYKAVQSAPSDVGRAASLPLHPTAPVHRQISNMGSDSGSRTLGPKGIWQSTINGRANNPWRADMIQDCSTGGGDSGGRVEQHACSATAQTTKRMPRASSDGTVRSGITTQLGWCLLSPGRLVRVAFGLLSDVRSQIRVYTLHGSQNTL